uniref:transmembrane and immunoglobulin domain-containing protein 2 n=1 Tax=Jaculus jaculus TaxID=51337 RepID=UPI001E1B03BD|nr:transmembrane and immunoglobulin domain-containing protein 2 [Jaculus jaculus]
MVFLKLWAVWEACGLSVLQWPLSLRVKPGGMVTLACQVTQIQAWERLRVEWTRNEDGLCHMFLTNASLSPEVCGPRGWLSWKVPGDLTLQLGHVSVNDSGDYVCRAILEIPEFDEAQGNGTELLVEADAPPQLQEKSIPPGLQLALLVVGGVVAAAVLLGVSLWGSRRCKREDSGMEGGCTAVVALLPPRVA